MLTWDTTWRLIKNGNSNPLLIGLTIDTIENEIQALQEKRELEDSLSELESELLRSFILKRHLLLKKLKEIINNQGIER